MDIFVVEFWSDEMRNSAWCEGKEHELNVCHFASSKERAIEWCEENFDYAAKPGETGYYPWHFRVRRRLLDEDTMKICHPIEEVVYDSRDEIISETEVEAGWEESIDLSRAADSSDTPEPSDDDEEEDKDTKETLVEKLPGFLRNIAQVVEDCFSR